MWTNHLRGSLEWMLMVALVLGGGAIVQAQQEDEQPEGRIVQIGPGDDQRTPEAEEAQPTLPGFPEQAPQPNVPRYWIGMLGGPVPDALRAHLDIPIDQGVLVREVVPGSPADAAGLKQFDVLLRANDTEVRDMSDLVDLVRTEGERQGQITLELLRRGQRETVWVTPAERPVDAGQPGGFGAGGMPGDARGWLQQFGENMPFEFRTFGPGIIVGRPHGLAQIPNGVSVSIRKQAGQPTEITVQRGDETWKIVGDDPQSLDQLPEDIRPFVEQMVRGDAVADFNIPQQMPMMPQFDGERLRERLEAMEKRLQEMQDRFQRLNEPNNEEAQ